SESIKTATTKINQDQADVRRVLTSMLPPRSSYPLPQQTRCSASREAAERALLEPWDSGEVVGSPPPRLPTRRHRRGQRPPRMRVNGNEQIDWDCRNCWTL